MVNPRVPSGILGPCAACRGLAARLSKCPGAPAACAEECGVCGGLPRPLPHGFLAPTCWSWSSSCCQDECANRAHQLAADMVRGHSMCQSVAFNFRLRCGQGSAPPSGSRRRPATAASAPRRRRRRRGDPSPAASAVLPSWAVVN
jgi:hypothetical protein